MISDTRVSTIHTQSYLPLHKNGSFQNYYETAFYKKFTHANYAQVCIPLYIACMPFKLSQISQITREKTILPLQLTIQACGISTRLYNIPT